MIRSNIISGFILFVILALNGITIYSINKRYVNFLNQTLLKQSQLCGEYMETTLLQFSSDINHELDKFTYSEIFGDPAKFRVATQSLRLFYTKYRDLITTISVSDDKKNFYALYLDTEDKFGKTDHFVVDSFPRKFQPDLHSRHRVEQEGSILKYYYPYFGQDKVNGNVMVEVDIERFARDIFNLYPVGQTVHWQWMLDAEGNIMLHNFGTDSIEIDMLSELADSVDAEAVGIIEHKLHTREKPNEKIYTAYYPLSIYARKMGIMFSVSRSLFFGFFLHRNLQVAIFSQLLATGLVVYLLIGLGRYKKRERRLKLSEIVFRQIIEHYPVGIMIIDEMNIIRNINSAAQKMLFLGKSDNLVGKDFNKQFLISNKYLLSDSPSPFLDDSHYLYYEKDGIETVIYRT
ncbi:MAG: PAS domain-containing protein [Bacteroidales bacterium]|nr:PAS domain-containing protein [Bacteroidales bacterium]